MVSKQFFDSEDVLTCSAHDWFLTNNANPEDHKLIGLQAYCNSGSPQNALLNKLKENLKEYSSLNLEEYSSLNIVAIVGYIPNEKYPAATLIVENRQNKTLIKPSEIEKKVEQSLPFESTDGQFSDKELVHSGKEMRD